MKAIEKLNPTIDSAKNITIKNREMMNELQDVMQSFSEKMTPESENTNAFSPKETGMELEKALPEEGKSTTEEIGIPEEEVEKAMNVETEKNKELEKEAIEKSGENTKTEEESTPEEEIIEEQPAETTEE